MQRKNCPKIAQYHWSDWKHKWPFMCMQITHMIQSREGRLPESLFLWIIYSCEDGDQASENCWNIDVFIRTRGSKNGYTEIATEHRYALRMLGLELDGPCRMFGDNNSVILNTTTPSSMLKKKHQSIAYHAVRTAQAAGIIDFQHIKSEVNFSDVMTKPLPNQRFHTLVRPLLFRRSSRWNWFMFEN